jgi:thiol:disulfide interchange protein DsbD
MIVFKQVMSFPMFATAVWLIWVFGNQKGVNGESFLIAGLVPLSVGFWILGKWDLPHLSVTSRWVSKFFFILFLTLSFWFLWKGSKENVSVETITTSAIWQKFDPLVISEMEKNHQAYFINFTALSGQ